MRQDAIPNGRTAAPFVDILSGFQTPSHMIRVRLHVFKHVTSRYTCGLHRTMQAPRSSLYCFDSSQEQAVCLSLKLMSCSSSSLLAGRFDSAMAFASDCQDQREHNYALGLVENEAFLSRTVLVDIEWQVSECHMGYGSR
jgi:hypothetical protein